MRVIVLYMVIAVFALFVGLAVIDYKKAETCFYQGGIWSEQGSKLTIDLLRLKFSWESGIKHCIPPSGSAAPGTSTEISQSSKTENYTG